jgi:hypothetical protein
VTVPVARTTLLAIDCRQPRLAARALKLSLEQCSFERAKLLTDDAGAAAYLDPRIELVLIPPLRSAAEYSRFVLLGLLPHVDSAFVQIVQWDGYVTRGDAWRREFHDYDYIGARWHFHKDGRDVGNGGFSLRSRKLLAALQGLGMDLSLPEDHLICRAHRGTLEQRHGIRFAPGALADAYAFEGLEPTGAEFGFHRVFNLPYFHDEAALAELLGTIPDPDYFNNGAVTLVFVLMHLRRRVEALRYARRLAGNPALLAKLDPPFRAQLDKMLADLA